MSANDDGVDHARDALFDDGILRLNWEDLTGGGDQDFNDAVVYVATEGQSLAGVASQTVPITVSLTGKEAKFENELGIFIVDDAQGRIGELAPGEEGYQEAALSNARAQTVFRQGADPGFQTTVELPGGSFYGWYLIADSSRSAIVNEGAEVPVWFSFPEANTDGLAHFVPRGDGRYSWEDLPEGGDRDFNDLEFRVEIGNPVGTPIPPPPAPQPDPVPELIVAPLTVAEGNQNSTADLTLQLSTASLDTVTVDFNSADSTAIAGEDYEQSTGTVIFLPGETQKALTVNLLGDVIDEEDEQFFIEFTNPVGVDIVTNPIAIDINDDDDAPAISVAPVTVSEGDEADVVAEFVVSLSNPSAKVVSVDYDTIAGTATPGEDYETISGRLTFAPGETELRVSVSIVGDILDERDEAFTLELSNPSNGVVQTASVLGTIIDNDPEPELRVSNIAASEGDEGSTAVAFEVSLAAPSSLPVTVDFVTADETAIAGVDYEATAGTVRIEPGETLQTVPVVLLGDQVEEDDEAFTLSLFNGVNANIVDGEGLATIEDDDPLPTLSVEGFSSQEGDEGTVTGDFVVTLAGATSFPVSFDFATTDGTATEGEDYEAVNGRRILQPGETTLRIPVSILGDLAMEGDETFTLSLSNITNATISTGSATAVILDDDSDIGRPTLSVDDVSLNEGDVGVTQAEFMVTLSEASEATVSVDFRTSEDSATAAVDYTPVNGTLTFAPGETEKLIVVEIIGDGTFEADETFSLTLSESINADILDEVATGTIFNDDPLPVLSVDGFSLTEGDDGTTPGQFTVTLTGDTEVPVTFNFSTNDGTALMGLDYEAINGTQTIQPGQTELSFSVNIIGDRLSEDNETFTFTLTDVANAELAVGEAIATIIDDDESETSIQLIEGVDFQVSAERAITIPNEPSVLSFNVVGLNFDTTDTNAINDAFEAALVDAEGNSLVNVIESSRDAFVNFTETQDPVSAIGTTVDSQTVLLNLAGIEPGTLATLSLRLINNDIDTETAVTIEGIEIIAADVEAPPGVTPTVSPTFDGESIDFGLLEDVSASLTPEYAQTSFNEETNTLFAELIVQNQGQYLVDNPLIVAVDALSDPSVRVIDIDGFTPNGLPYYDLSSRINQGTLAPGQVTSSTNLTFFNPSGEQFEYELVFLGRLNQNPQFISEPNIEGVNGTQYNYQSTAEDVDGDVLSYSLILAPEEMSIDEETGLLGWDIGPEDVGRHTVIVGVNDGRNGFDEQAFTISVVEEIPNRPPIFTSTPIVDGNVGQEYRYQAMASDLDGDVLSFVLDEFPEEMTIEPNTGEIVWTPQANQLGSHDITVMVDDSRGGTSAQIFQIAVEAAVGNQNPIFISDPLTNFNLPGLSNPSQGNVVPDEIDLELILDEVGEETVTITLPPSNNVGEPPGNSEEPGPIAPAGFDILNEGVISPGQQEIFEFDAPAGLKVYLDSLGGSSNLVFSLFNPDGTEIFLPAVGRPFVTNDFGPFTFNQDGTYQLIVEGAGATSTGDYRFIFRNVSDSPSLTLDGINTGEVVTGLEDLVFPFSATAGQQLIFTPDQSDTSVRFTLFEPNDDFISPTFSATVRNNVILPETGNYLLVVDSSSQAPANFRVNISANEPITPAVPITLGEIVEGLIANPGETDIFRFSGIAGQQLYFDGQTATASSDFSAQLISPDGQRLFINPGQADGQALNRNRGPFTLTETGTYQLVVTGFAQQGQVTGDYRFNLIDLATIPAEPLNSLTGSLAPGLASGIFRFSGIAGERLFFQNQGTDPLGTLSLFGPGNNEILDRALNVSNFERTLPDTGTYTAIVESNNLNEPFEFNFEVLRPNTNLQELSLGTPVEGNLAQLGDRAIYNFAGERGDRFYYDGRLVKSPENITLIDGQLITPSQDLLFDQDVDDDFGPFTIPETGIYQFAVDGTSGATGNFQFNLIDEANFLSLDLNELPTALNGVLAARESQVFEFDTQAGVQLRFNNLENNGNNRITLFGPSNQTIFFQNLTFTDLEEQLRQEGKYLLVIEGNNVGGTYNFEIVADLSDNNAIAPEDFGFFSVAAGEVREITFNAPAGLSIYIDALATRNDLEFDLLNPDGTVEAANLEPDFGPLFLAQSGTYTLTARGLGNPDETFDFNLVNLSALPTQDIATLPLAGTLETSFETDFFRFEASAGQRLFVENQGSDGGGLLLFYGPQDRANQPLTRVGLGAPNFEVTLPEAGTYLLAVEGSGGGSPINYDFDAFVTEVETVPLTLGDVIADTLVQPGDNRIYTFDSAAGETLYFDGQFSDSSFVQFQILSPSRSELFPITNRTLDRDFAPITLQETGTYQLIISGNRQTDFDYQFQLSAIEFEDTLPPLLEGTLDPGLATDLYTFTATAGEKFLLRNLSDSSLGNIRLYRPSGNLVATIALSALFTVTLPEDGPYLLAIEGTDRTPGATVNYSLEVQTPETLINTDFEFGETIADTLATVADRHVYTFDAIAGQQFYFDGQFAAEERITAELVLPSGAINNLGRAFFSVDSNSRIVTLTESGLYRLVISGNDQSSGDYQFRLLDVEAQPSLTLAEEFAGTFNPGRESDLFRFNAEAGQQLFLNSLINLDDAHYNLYGPGDRTLIVNRFLRASQTVNGEQPTADEAIFLPVDGTYILALEGDSDESDIAYGFEVEEVFPLEIEDLTTLTPTELVDFLVGDGVTFTNVSFTGSDMSAGTFSNGTAQGIGIEQGIILSSGDVESASGPNLIPFASTEFFTPGDEDLNRILDPGPGDPLDRTNDGAVLEFDFIPSSNQISFEYVFASEEYNEFVGSQFNDVFGFFLNGENIALIPETTDAVAINSVNRNLNSDFFRDNDPAQRLVSYDGLTTVLTAQADVNVGQVNRIKLVIADTIDFIYDSAVFLRRGSFNAVRDIDLLASDPAVNLTNLTGVIESVAPGESATFDLEIVGDDVARSFDLLFVEANTGELLGSTPVTVNNDYFYLAQAIDPDGDDLTYSFLDRPEGATINAQTGLINWEPAAPGEEDFILLVEDGRSGSAVQAFTVTTTRGATNAAPTITSTEPTQAGAGREFVYQVTATDLDGDRLSYYLRSTPDGAQINRQTGTLTWLPTPNQVGTQTLEVLVLDGQGGEDTQRFDVEVSPAPINQSPELTSIPILDATVGQTYRYQATAADPNSDPLAFELTLSPEGMTVNPQTGQVVWEPTPDQSDRAFDIALRVRDDRGGFDLQYYQINVAPLNSDPEITSTPSLQALVDRPYEYQIRAQDANDDRLSFRLSNPPDNVSLDEDTGRLTWLPTADQLGSQVISVEAIDGEGGRAVQSFSIEVLLDAPNDEPVILSNPRTSITFGRTYLYQVIATDPNGDPLAFDLPDAPDGMTIDETGLIIWEPAPEQFGPNSVTLEISDGRGGVVTQDFVVSVLSQGTNQLPTITSNPLRAATARTRYRYDALAEDLDGDLVLWSLENAPEGMSIDEFSGTIRWIPQTDQLGGTNITLQAQDAQGGIATQTFTIDVRGANQPPTFSSTPQTTAVVGEVYTYILEATDIEGDRLTFELLDFPENMTIDPDTGVIRWEPNSSQVGSNLVSIAVDDNQGGRLLQRYSLQVVAEAVNESPAITSLPPQMAAVGEFYEYFVTAVDPEGQTLNFSLNNFPDGMEIDEDTGAISWTPEANQVGITTVTIQVEDTGGERGFQTFDILIGGDNQAPEIVSEPPSLIVVGQTYQYDVVAEDADGDPLIYFLESDSETMTLDQLGRLRWQPTEADIGPVAVAIEVRDPLGSTGLQQFTLTVVQDIQAPIIDIILDSDQVEVGSRVTIRTTATDDVGIVSLDVLADGEPLAVGGNGEVSFLVETIGPIDISAIAVDLAGNETIVSVQLIGIDPNIIGNPVIEIASPSIGDTITNLIEVVGTVEDEDLLFYSLELAPFDSQNFTEIFRSTEPVSNGVLGRVDPTLLNNDSYTLRLVAVDEGGNTSILDQIVNVAGDLKLGNFQVSFADLSVPLSGIPITVTRTYSSLQADVQNDFGFGWSLDIVDTDLRTTVPKTGLEDSLIFNPFEVGTKVYITTPDGRREGFTFRPERQEGLKGNFLRIFKPHFEPDPGVTSELSVPNFDLFVNQTDPILPIAPGDQVFSFGTSLPFNPANVAFGGAYLLETRDGNTYQINGITGDIVSATDRNRNQLRFESAGIFSSTGKEILFRRNPQGQIVEIIDPAGNSIFYEYDLEGDLVQVTDREDNMTQFIYRSDLPHYLEEIVDPLGRTGSRSEYDENGRLSRIVDINGEAVEFDFNLDENTQTVFDARNNPTQFIYDDRGNILLEIDPLQGVRRRTFDENNNILTEIDPRDNLTTFIYDENGNVLRILGELGDERNITYDSEGQVTATIDPLGNVTQYIYDDRGNIEHLVNPDGKTVDLTYDTAGNILTQSDAGGNITTREYNPFGYATRIVDPLENEQTFTYDDNGNQLTATRQQIIGDELETLTTTFEYNQENRPITIIDALEGITRIEYNALGLVEARVDALERRTSFEYDANGNLLRTNFPDQTFSINEYDAADNRVVEIDRAGRVTQFDYDALNRLILTILADDSPDDLTDNPIFRTEYDPNGNITAEIDPRGNRTEFEYDELNRQTIERDALENEAFTTYDLAGRVVAETDFLGNKVEFEYDNAGRLLATTFPNGAEQNLIYDEAGRLQQSIDEAGETTTFEYDDNNQLTAVIDTLGERTEYTYDEAGNLIAQRDRNRNVTRFEYDALNRETAVILPLGQRSETEYDAVGNITSFEDFNGQTITFEYNEGNRLMTRRFPDTTTVEFTYTDAGLVETISDRFGTTFFEYDEQDRLLSRTDPDGTAIAYTYDDAGNRTSVTTFGETTTYAFDRLNRLETVTEANGDATTYTYNANSNLIRTEFSNQTFETRAYDALNRLISIEHFAPDQSLIDSFTYTLDLTGRRIAVDELDGRRVEYGYDELYRLIEERIFESGGASPVETVAYTYDEVGNRLSRDNSNSGLTSYDYDLNDRLSSEVNPDEEIIYTYDDNGNQISQTINGTLAKTYIWNVGNRLIGVDIDGDGELDIEYAYNSDGQRIREINNREEKRFLVDANRPFSQVLVEYRPDRTVDVRYVHGLDLIAQIRNTAKSIYHVDGLGSTRLLTNENGTVTDRYLYDAFGQILTSTGNTPNRYLFTGEEFDANAGLTYLRARYVDTSTGRFLSRDPFVGFIQDPITLHRYLYTNSDPVNNIDPSGEITLGFTFGLPTIQVSIGIISTLVGVGVGYSIDGNKGAIFGGIIGAAAGTIAAIAVPALAGLGTIGITVKGSVALNVVDITVGLSSLSVSSVRTGNIILRVFEVLGAITGTQATRSTIVTLTGRAAQGTVRRSNGVTRIITILGPFINQLLDEFRFARNEDEQAQRIMDASARLSAIDPEAAILANYIAGIAVEQVGEANPRLRQQSNQFATTLFDQLG
ncbi:MAG: Calx-beta domain-containing protein [Cyanobacteria bacterium P01_H01_bin.15]